MIVVRSLTAASILLAASFAAQADDMTFCSSDTNKCVTAAAKNSAFVVSTAVVVTQEGGTAACPKVEKKHKGNLAIGEGFKVGLSAACKYKFHFKTTNGCTGSKTNHMTADDIENNMTKVELGGDCGTLYTKKYLNVS